MNESLGKRDEGGIQNCQNCGQQLNGPYCYSCGQKHIGERESFGKFILHFLGDFIHFDSKVFITLRPLLFKPGLVPLDYVAGKRVKYLDPVRMYVFLSIIFFALFFFYQENTDKATPVIKIENNLKEVNDSPEAASSDSLVSEKSPLSREKEIISIDPDSFAIYQDTVKDQAILSDGPKRDNGGIGLRLGNRDLPATPEEYLLGQEKLKKEDRDSWFVKAMILKGIHIKERAKSEKESFFDTVKQEFLKTIPKIFFILLPLFALILKLLYVRKGIYYLDHFIFTTYFYNAYFILFSIVFLIEIVSKVDLSGFAYILAAVYFLIGMFRFYQQKTLKTLVKFTLFMILSGFMTILGLIGASIWTIFKL
jgi:hypothetical protein